MTRSHKPYDEVILAHYREQAQKHGDSSCCTMEDSVIRTKETAIISDCTREFIRLQAGTHRDNGSDADGPGYGSHFHIVDFGCGNGTTLQSLIDLDLQPRGCSPRFTGVEYSSDMRAIAENRFKGVSNVTIVGGDVRSIDRKTVGSADILILQRVLINLLEPADQRAALDCIVELLAPGGLLIALEGFQAGLDTLNEARAEFALEPLQSAHHNLYLPDGFFDHELLEPWSSDGLNISPEVFSTHDFISRVFHEVLLRATNAPFRRNSHFVEFFTTALPDGVGGFARIKLVLLRKVIRR